MIKIDESSRQPKSSRSARDGESGADLAQMTYEFMSDENSAVTATSARPIPAPKLKQNLAYGKVKVPEAGQN